MRVIGIDPGLTRTGYGIVERVHGRLRAVAFGTIRARTDRTVPQNLLGLCLELERVIEQHEPEIAACERVFFNANVRTAIQTGQASGVALLAAAESGLDVVQYTPTEVKASVVGVGNASKDQVGFMVGRILALTDAPDSADAVDALALAICHSNGQGMRSAIEAAQRSERTRTEARR